MIFQLVWLKYGWMMKVICDDEDVVIVMGVNIFCIKICVFVISVFFEGIGGGLLVFLLIIIFLGLFDFMFIFQLLIIIVFGGFGSIIGVLFGIVLVVGSGEWLCFFDQLLQFFGYDFGVYLGL